MSRGQQRGQAAENQACEYLQKKGLRLIERNYRCRQGEIDLVMSDADTIVFIEVRYRSNPAFGSAAESVDRRKQSKLIVTATHYLQQAPCHAQRPARFDVISMSGNSLEWIRDAFQAAP